MIMEDQDGTPFSPTYIIHASHSVAGGKPVLTDYAVDCEGRIRFRHTGTGNASWTIPLRTQVMNRDEFLALLGSWGGEEIL